MEPIILSAIVAGLVEVCKRTWIKNNLVYPLALVFGVGAFLLGGPGAPWGESILNGLVIGLGSVGLYEGAKRLPVINTILTRGK